jgi:hypothetical protein
MVQMLHGHLQTLQRNADPFGFLCQLLLVWGGKAVRWITFNDQE